MRQRLPLLILLCALGIRVISMCGAEDAPIELVPEGLPVPVRDHLPDAPRPPLPENPAGVLRELPIHQRQPICVTISLDGKYLVVGGTVDGIEIFNLGIFGRIGILKSDSKGVRTLA